LHGDEYFEYLLGDPSYLGEEMFIMRRIGRCEIGPNADQDVIKAYNKIHAGYGVRVEWGISGLKRKWRRIMKRFDSTKPKNIILFKVVTILTNFLHRCQMDFTFEVIGEQLPNPTNHGWDENF
jgi:hypothetical protein